MFENPRRGRQARNFTTNAPKILDLKSSSEQIFSRKLPLGVPEQSSHHKVFSDPQIGIYVEIFQTWTSRQKNEVLNIVQAKKYPEVPTF